MISLVNIFGGEIVKQKTFTIVQSKNRLKDSYLLSLFITQKSSSISLGVDAIRDAKINRVLPLL